jgi:endonuclease/exonuclease/phosphatase family metal-dependent hydrolase
METLKLLLWNVEWMNDLFDTNGNFRPDTAVPQHSPGTTVRTRRNHLSGVITEVDPDMVIIVEGPNSDRELKLFFDNDISGTWITKVQPTSGSSQLVGCAIRTDRGKFDAANPFTFFDTVHKDNFPEFQPFDIDTEDDGVIERYRFERSPLYVEVHTAGGNAVRFLGLHLKSKGIFDAYEWSKWWEVADANRRKLLAQATQIRLQFLNKYLTNTATKDIPLIVCGDINDGPGMDVSEKRLLGSGIERLMGTVWHPQLCLGNALFDYCVSAADQRNLRFEKIYTTSFSDPIFNNVWHKEWIDHVLYSRNRPLPWVTSAKIIIEMADGQKIWEKYKFASDHMPVQVEISL